MTEEKMREDFLHSMDLTPESVSDSEWKRILSDDYYAGKWEGWQACAAKSAEKIAMLRNVLHGVKNGIEWYAENSDDADESDAEMLLDIEHVLSATQQDADRYEAGVKAGALKDMPEGWAEAVNLAYNIHTDLVAPENVSKKGIKELASVIMNVDAKAAELRNQAQGKEGGK